MGSSKKNIFAPETIDLANARRCFCPTDSLFPRSPILVFMPLGRELTNSKRFVSERACNILFLLIFLLP